MRIKIMDCNITALKCKQKFAKIAEEFKDIFYGTEYETQFNEFDEQYNYISSREKICIAVVGGWSTGKSTIIKALTDDKNIECGSGTTTHKASRYEYKGVTIIDTPGLLSRNDEDTTISNEEIKKADIIIYCIINDGFGYNEIQEFKEILSNADHYDKIILAINKFDKELDFENDMNEVFEKSIRLLDTVSRQLEKNNIDDSLISMVVFSALKFIEGKEQNNNNVIERSLFEGLIDEVNDVDNYNGETWWMKKCIKEKNLFLNFINKVYSDIRAKNNDYLNDRNNEVDEKYKELDETTKKIFRNCRKELLNRLNDINECNSIEEFCEELNNEINEELKNSTKEAQDNTQKLYESYIKSNDFEEPEMNSNERISVKGKFKKKSSKKNTNSSNLLIPFFEWVQQKSSQVVDMAKPVVTSQTGFLFWKKKIYSDVGGSGTTLYKLISKIRIFGQNTGKVAAEVSKTAGVIVKHGDKIFKALVVAGYLKDISDIVIDSKYTKRIEMQKKEWRKNINEIVDERQRAFLEYQKQCKKKCKSRVYSSDFDKRISLLKDKIEEIELS